MRDLKKHLGNRLKKFRERAQLTQDSLGQISGVRKMTISRIEGGYTWPEYDNLVAIAQVLKIEVSDFFADLPSPPANPDDALQVIANALGTNIPQRLDNRAAPAAQSGGLPLTAGPRTDLTPREAVIQFILSATDDQFRRIQTAAKLAELSADADESQVGDSSRPGLGKRRSR